MSHKPKRSVKGLLAGLLAVCASAVLASPALAATTVKAGSLTFSSDDNITVAGGTTQVAYTTSTGEVTISGGQASINVTQGDLQAGQTEVSKITFANTYNGAITFNDVTIGGTAGIQLILNGANNNGVSGAKVTLNGCNFTSPNGQSVITIGNAALNNELVLNSGNTLKSGNNTDTIVVNATNTAADDEFKANIIQFSGSNVVDGNGASAISTPATATGYLDIYMSGNTTLQGGASGDAVISFSAGNVLIDASGRAIVDAADASPAMSVTGKTGDAVDAVVTITGSGLTLAGGDTANTGNGLNITGAATSSNYKPSAATGVGIVNVGDGDATGALVVIGGNGAGGSAAGFGVSLVNYGALVVNEGSSVEAIGGNGTTAGGAGAHGISGATNSTVSVAGGTLNATGGNSTGSISTSNGGNGINGVNNLNLTGNAVVTVTGGATTDAALGASALGSYGLDGTIVLSMSNDTNVNGEGPVFTATGNKAVDTTDITWTLNSGNLKDKTFYPWLVQKAAEADGSDPSLVTYAKAPNLTSATVTLSDNPAYLNIAPHPVTGLEVSLTNENTGSFYVAPYVVPAASGAKTPVYTLAVSPVFDIELSDIQPVENGGSEVAVTNGTVAPEANVAWVSQTAGTFYVPTDASGASITVGGSIKSGALGDLADLYPNLPAPQTQEIPIVYTVDVNIASAQGCFGTNNAPAASLQQATYYTSDNIDEAGQLVQAKNAPGDYKDNLFDPGDPTTLPVVWDSKGTIENDELNLPAKTALLGFFVEEPEDDPSAWTQMPASQTVFTQNTTLQAETGTLSLTKIAPTPTDVAQGSSVTITATFTIDPANDDITVSSFNDDGISVGWHSDYVLPTGSISDGTANGMVLEGMTVTTSAGTTGNAFTVDASVIANVNPGASLGSFHVIPSFGNTDLAQYGTTGTVAPYALVTVTQGSGGPTSSTTVYRLLNPFTGAHLITADYNEWETLSTTGGWNDEGIAFISASSGVPVFRLYNPNNGDHMYTTSTAEYDRLGTIGWLKEGTVFYGAVSSPYPIYRLWNQQMTANGGLGSHLWTADHNEYVTLPTLAPNGWVQEGEAWFAAALEPGENA